MSKTLGLWSCHIYYFDINNDNLTNDIMTMDFQGHSIHKYFITAQGYSTSPFNFGPWESNFRITKPVDIHVHDYELKFYLEQFKPHPPK